jgi:hypothetical protein
MPSVFYGEQDGPRVIGLSNDLTQVTEISTEDVLLTVEYHEVWPAGSAGDAVLRELTPIVRTNNGATYRVTPIVDGVRQTPQEFTVVGAAIQPQSVYPTNTDQVRGSRFGVLVEQLSPRTGDFEVIDVGYAIAVLRRTP